MPVVVQREPGMVLVPGRAPVPLTQRAAPVQRTVPVQNATTVISGSAVTVGLTGTNATQVDAVPADLFQVRAIISQFTVISLDAGVY